MEKLAYTFLLCLIISASSFGQSQDTYKKIDYIKVDDDHLEQFLDWAENDLKSTYSDLVENGNMQSWQLYKAQFPGGEKSEYNFISVATAESMNLFEEEFSDITKPFIPSNSNEEVPNNSSLIKSEIWKVEDDSLLQDNGNTKPYMTMDYMDVAPGKGLDYLMLEEEIAKPIHKERIEQEVMAGWEVYSLVLPSGTKYGYNYATGNYFDKLEHVEFGFTNEVIQQAMGQNSNIPELFNTIYSTRELVKVELWQLVTYTN